MDKLSAFDESSYLPLPTRALHYKQVTELGREKAKDKRIAIIGLARNIGRVAAKTIARIEHTGEMFKDYRVVIYENDSIDDTPSQLRTWMQGNARVHVVSESLGHPINPGTRCLDRASRMAYYRNECKKYLLDRFPPFDYVLVVDTDLPGGWSYDGIANSIGQRAWDFMGSNGIIYKNWRNVHRKPLYYDVWAFRWHGDWEPCDSDQINPRVWHRGEDPLPVFSCFGGLGLYKMKAYASSEYDGTDCEHVPFHKRMFDQGFRRLFLNPSQIAVY